MLTKSEVMTLLEEGGLHPKRSLGQNFVIDPNTVRKVAWLAGAGPQRRVLEIGAGLGSLTMALAETGAYVVAVEIDRQLVPLLRRGVEPLGVHVVEGDALTIDFDEVLVDADGGADRSWSLVANLPYNVAVPVVVRVLEEAPQVTDMVVMVQREVANRLVAAPGSKEYGAVSVKVAYYCEASIAGQVPASVFYPRPKVESSLVRMKRRSHLLVDPAIVPPGAFFEVVRAGFAQRRKMLRRALAGVVAEDVFERSGIDPCQRAEQLGLDEWARLVAWNLGRESDLTPKAHPWS